MGHRVILRPFWRRIHANRPTRAHLNMAIIESATVAMSYAKQFREQAAHLSRQRAATVEWAQFPHMEDGAVKRNVLRELGHATATMKPTAKIPRKEKGPPSRQGRQGP